MRWLLLKRWGVRAGVVWGVVALGCSTTGGAGETGAGGAGAGSGVGGTMVGAGGLSAGGMVGGGASGGTAQGGTAQGGTAQGGTAQGGTAQGGTAQGGTAQGGTAQGGTAQGGTAQGGNAGAAGTSGGSAGEGTGMGGAVNAGGTAGTGAVGGAGGQGGSSGGSGCSNVFGATQYYQTANGGLEWDSSYWSGTAHELPFADGDPDDPLGLANQRGTGEVTVNGDGTLSMTGSQPRIYLGHVAEHPWLNVEVTVYYQRLEDDDTAYAGLVVGARSGPDGHGTDNCTATTYYARLRHDGNADLEKELEHPTSQTRESKAVWEGNDPPYNTWIGLKYIVTNVDDDQHVRLQVFRDMTEGVGGGDWEPLIDARDTGGWNPAHICEFAEDYIVTDGGGVVFIRNTGLTGPGAMYKNLTVREIAPDAPCR